MCIEMGNLIRAPSDLVFRHLIHDLEVTPLFIQSFALILNVHTFKNYYE